MGLPNPLSRALALALTSSVLAAGLAFLPATATAASADTMAASGGVETVSADPLPTVQVDGVVWDQAVSGDIVYVAGRFANAIPAGGGANTARANVLAYDIRTGELIRSFVANTNQQVRSIAVSPDGSRVYIGGAFTSVNNVARERIAALDARTGAVVQGFAPGANGIVYAVTATADRVYVGGAFTRFGGQQRTRAGAVAASGGGALPFAPVVPDFTVRGIVVSPDSQKVVLGGSFTSLNGGQFPGAGMGAVDAATGQTNLQWEAGKRVLAYGADRREGKTGEGAAIYDLSSDGQNVYGTGYNFYGEGNLEGSFTARWSDGDVQWVGDCRGDTYSITPFQGAVYIAGHPHNCDNIGELIETPIRSYQHSLAYDMKAKPDCSLTTNGFEGIPCPNLLTWFPDWTAGDKTGSNQAAWSVAAGEDYLVFGGEFPRVNGVAQAGLVRFAKKSLAPNTSGPRETGVNFQPSAVSLRPGTVRVTWPLNWDRDNEFLTYSVFRANDLNTPLYTTVAGQKSKRDRGTLGFVDTKAAPGSQVTYRVRATDPFGNTVIGAPSAAVTVLAGDGSSDAYADAVLADGAKSLWRMDAVDGTRIRDAIGFDDLGVEGAVSADAQAAVPNGSAIAFPGTDSVTASTRTAVQAPDAFAIETWFKTTSTSGGKIIGFGNSTTGWSSNYDRHVYMDGEGRVSFGVYPGAIRSVSSAPGLNDGEWHHVVANLGGGRIQLFIDGQRAGTLAGVDRGQSYKGYWRVGGDTSWAGDAWFDGSIDDTAIYAQPLSPTTIREHVALTGRTADSATPTDAYGAAVVAAEPDLYWRLDETDGPVRDSSGSGRSGIVSGGVVRGGPSAVVGSTASASFDGIDGGISSASPVDGPGTFSAGLWFRSTTTQGGKLLGFGTNQTGGSGEYDRHIYLLDDGRVRFGTWTGQTNIITSDRALNDGQWHQVVATLGAGGMQLFVDGALVGTDPNTGAQGMDGFWRVGGDVTWEGSSSWYSRADIDEVAVYPAVLTAAQVRTQFDLARGQVNTPPVASFTASTDGLQVAVDGRASRDEDGRIVETRWSFGDGGTATTPTATHRYDAAGDYTVTLTVVDDDGAEHVETRSVTVVAPNVAPIASFTAQATDLRVAVDARASTDTDGSVAAYAWNFGDGTTATGSTATRTYGAAGTYTVTLTVTDDDGATTTTTREVTVTAPVPVAVPPVASFTATTADLRVSVDGAASTDADGRITAYSWAFGDGTTATGRTAARTYGAAGTYTVALTVTDDAGLTATTTRQVTVTAPAPLPPLANDPFERSVARGLGTAPVGGPWILSGTVAAYEVSGGAARLTSIPARTTRAILRDTASTDVEVQSTVSFTALPSARTVAHASIIGRLTETSDYRSRLVIDSAGVATLEVNRRGTPLASVRLPGGPLAPGQVVQMRVQVTGTSPTTIRAKAWLVGDAEPGAWQVEAVDSTAGLQEAGTVGLGGYLADTATGQVTFAFDDLWAGRPGTRGGVR